MGQVTQGHFLPSTPLPPLLPEPLHFVFILVTSSWPGPLQSVPSSPCCQSDLLTVKIWPVLSQLEPFLSWGVHPLERPTQIQPDCKSLSDLAGTQEKERKGETEGRMCGLTSLAKIQQWTQKAGQDQTFIIHPIEKAFCNSNIFIYIHSSHSGLMEEIQVAIGPLRPCFNEETREPFHLYNHCLHGNRASKGQEIVHSCK